MKNNINRKEFFKLLGGAAAAGSLLSYGCQHIPGLVKAGGMASLANIDPQKMEYRTNP